MGEVIEVNLSAASPLSVADAAALAPAQKALILAAASKIAEADRLALEKAAADKLAAEQHDQSRAGRKERQEKAGALAE